MVEQEARYDNLPQPLGDVRQQTWYSLRQKPTKNTKYYHTSISQGSTIPNLENESAKPEMVFSSAKLETGNSNMENESAKPEMVFSPIRSETGNSNIKRRSILKSVISSKYIKTVLEN